MKKEEMSKNEEGEKCSCGSIVQKKEWMKTVDNFGRIPTIYFHSLSPDGGRKQE